jgi:hypothetical protein|tara:strand:- start:121 stop:309 length:189 start_codon:yes stop_codon:yes gene_type:complete
MEQEYALEALISGCFQRVFENLLNSLNTFSRIRAELRDTDTLSQYTKSRFFNQRYKFFHAQI